jgi:hypothetical protein
MHDSTTSAALGRAFLELLPVTGVSIAVFADATKRSTIYASDPVAARIDELQFDLGEGPSFDAVKNSRPVLIGDLGPGTSDRWPMFANGLANTAADGLAGSAAQALFVFPLMMGAICVGVASLYSNSPGDLDQDEVDAGTSTARSIAGPALRHAVRLSEDEHELVGSGGSVGSVGPIADGTADGTADDVNGGAAGDPPATAAGNGSTTAGGSADEDTTGGGAIELRRDIHQATGMVLAQLDISPTDAFSRLRAHAFSTNRTVQEVARDVLARRLNFSQLSDDSR